MLTLASQESNPASPSSEVALANAAAVPCGNGAVLRALHKKPAAKSAETYRVGKRKQPPQYFIMKGKEFIVGLTKTRHPAFKDLIEQLAQVMSDGEVPTNEAAKERLAAMMAEKA